MNATWKDPASSRYTADEMRLVADNVCSDFTFAQINTGSDSRPTYMDVKPYQVADMLRQAVDDMERLREENARLRNRLEEAEKALKPILDEYIPDYDMCDCCHEDCPGHGNGETCEWKDVVEAARKTRETIGGCSWTRISRKS